MTRMKWTSTDQEEWLKSWIAGFSDAQADKTTSKVFFLAVFKEWRQSWAPDPSPEEIMQAGSVEKATLKRKNLTRAYII